MKNECFPTGFCRTRLQNQSFVPGFRGFSSHVRKCHACNGICTLAPLCAALTMRLAKKTRNMKLRDDANLMRLPRKIDVDALKRTRVGATLHSRDKASSVLERKRRKAQKTPPRAFPLGREFTTTTTTTRRAHYDDTTMSPRRAHDDTTQHDANTAPTPRPPTINGNPSLRFREKYQTIIYSLTKNHYIQSLCHYVMCSQKLKMSF